MLSGKTVESGEFHNCPTICTYADVIHLTVLNRCIKQGCRRNKVRKS